MGAEEGPTITFHHDRPLKQWRNVQTEMKECGCVEAEGEVRE